MAGLHQPVRVALMPRISVPGFVGPSNVLRSPAADIEDTYNWYLEGVAPGKGQKSEQYYLPTPGLVPYASVDDTPNRFPERRLGWSFRLIQRSLTYHSKLAHERQREHRAAQIQTAERSCSHFELKGSLTTRLWCRG